VSDELESISQTADLENGYTEDEIKEIDALFVQDPEFDVIKDESTASETSNQDNQDPPKEVTTEDIGKMKKDELVALVTDLQKQLKDSQDKLKTEIESRDSKITSLEESVKNNQAVITQREDEVNKYVDKNAILEQKLKNAVIQNIIDLKMTDNILKNWMKHPPKINGYYKRINGIRNNYQKFRRLIPFILNVLEIKSKKDIEIWLQT
jgi:hypothetical protein